MGMAVTVSRISKLRDELKAGENNETGQVFWELRRSWDTSDASLSEWRGTVCGPLGTTFDNRLYSLSIECGDDYPKVMPSIKFIDRVNMEGVDDNGLADGVMERMAWTADKSIK